MKPTNINKILTLLIILLASLIASFVVSRESMAPGDYPGVHYDKSNAVPEEVLTSKNGDIPDKPNIYGNLSWGWSGFGEKVKATTGFGSGSK